MFPKNNICIILYLTLFVILVYERIFSTFYHDKRPPRVNVKLYQPLSWLLITGYIGAVLISLYEFVYVVKFISILLAIYGLVLLAAAKFLRKKAIAALGNEWDLSMKIFPKQQLITKGIYKKLKHPYHYSVLLELLGFSFFSNSFFGFIFIILIQLPMLFVRIVLEESILSRKFGSQYLEYTKATII